jgi:hypothetical protein
MARSADQPRRDAPVRREPPRPGTTSPAADEWLRPGALDRPVGGLVPIEWHYPSGKVQIVILPLPVRIH